MSNKPTKGRRVVKRKPKMPWQVDAYERLQTIQFFVPYNLLLLCRITGITPWKLISDFLSSLEGYDMVDDFPVECREIAVDYFISQGYGKENYSEEELRQMFAEMQALKMLFPHDNSASEQLVDDYCAWREGHQAYWFDKWFYRGRKP